MAYGTILNEVTGALARLTLNRPRVMNALDRTMVAEIGRALDEAERDEAVRAVVITGAGRAFCAGVDLRWAQAALCAELVDKSPVTMRLSKRLLNRAALVDIEARLEMAIMAAAVNGASEDYREGLKAFAEKRKPVYTGR